MTGAKLILSAHIRHALTGEEAIQAAVKLLRCAAELIDRGATFRSIGPGMLDENFTDTGAVDPRWKGKLVLTRDYR